MILVAGVDEVGRGPLAGPVVAAAVILDPEFAIQGLDDSKKFGPQRRVALAALVHQRARAVGIGEASVDEIDRLNILNASLLAMERAVKALEIVPGLALIDGNRAPRLDGCETRCIVGGDGLEPAISAASIVAKVYRDRLMLSLHQRYPEYGFDRHMGYGTAFHLAALERLGPTPEHRRSFRRPRQAALF